MHLRTCLRFGEAATGRWTKLQLALFQALRDASDIYSGSCGDEIQFGADSANLVTKKISQEFLL